MLCKGYLWVRCTKSNVLYFWPNNSILILRQYCRENNNQHNEIFFIYNCQSCGFKDNKWMKTGKSIRTSQSVWQVRKMTSPDRNAVIETRKRQHDLRWNDDMTCWLGQKVQGQNVNQNSTCSPEAHWYPGTGSEGNYGNISHCSTDALICWSFRRLLCNRGGSSCRIVW